MTRTDADRRPSPEVFLRLAREEEAVQGRGRLKLFFGMCPGVGKTYTMLEAARQRLTEARDVVVGLVETHGRAETEALLRGLEVLPRRQVRHQGVPLGEFDLDAALARQPRLILVDELAHTNAPGSRHAKRWQDVAELLDAGIDVYTTLNVQHWESLNDVVARVTGRVVRETVPDTFLRRADEIELVDISPEDLLQRLREGKVYQGDMAERAAESFFRVGNLIALRELALRHVAERVDAQMEAFRERHAIHGVWDVGERLLVGVSSGPMTARLIRATARLATRLRASWIAAYVETPQELRLPAEDRARVTENLRLADQLGAETLTRSGQQVTEELLLLAKERNVTKIVLGKPARPRWKEWLHGSVVNEMARHSGDVDLYVISGVGAEPEARRPPGVSRPEPARKGVAWGLASVVVATLFCWPLFPHVDRANLIMIYLVGVAWTAYRHGRVPSLVAATASVLAFDFFYVAPHLTFAVSDTQYLLTFGVMLGVGVLISALADRLYRQNEQMRRREARLRALYGLSLELSETPEPERLLDAAQQRLQEFYGTPVVLITRQGDGSLAIAAGDAGRFPFDDNERAVAQWVLDHGQIAGAGTETLRAARALYAPLRGTQTTVGVLGVLPREGLDLSDPEQVRLLETFAGGIGGALESTRMTAAAGRAEMMLELQALQAPAGSPRRLGDCLTAETIRFIEPGTSPEEVFRDLIATLRLSNPALALQLVLEREKSGSTEIGSGVSVPHARMPSLPGIRAALGLMPAGPSHIWVLFLGPEEKPELVLEFLAGLAAFFRSEENIATLLASRTPAEALSFLRSCGCACSGTAERN